ncbi:MAG: N-6 DNA methylase [Candidatus Parcubacteria bacterium]|nr:N-6 DNA methylase [Candidatus Parcubacteria bacterium]
MDKIIHLESRINQIYDHLYANSPVRIPTAIAKEVGKILRSLAYIEEHEKQKPAIFLLLKENKFENDKDIIKQVAILIRQSFKNANDLSRFYESENDINLTDSNIAFVCGKLCDIQITTTQRDVFGDAMEIFRSHWAKSNGGQFFTDQKVTQLAIKLLQFNPLNGDDFIDICAGTGGFLIAALKHIKELANGNEEKARKIAGKALLGQEIDKELADIANSTIAFQLGLPKSTLVNRGDSILQSVFGSNNNIKYNSHLCLATNPPFGTKITIKDAEILGGYELAKTYTREGLFGEESRIIQRAPDILFIEQNIKLLRPGTGRLAIVVPYQIVSGPQTLFVRQWILKHAEILAVIDLPPETFQPHTGTKASLLVLKRREKALDSVDLSKDGKIFMSTPKWIGHDRRGNPTYKKAEDGSTTDQILTDFPTIEKDFSAFLAGEEIEQNSSISFVITPEKIANEQHLRLDARFYRSHKINQEHFSNNKKNEDWDYIKVKDVVGKIFYPGRFARNYVNNDVDSIPFLGGTNISQLLLRTEKRIGINSPKVDELKVKEGWILITRSGSVGIVSTVPIAWDGFAFSEHVIRIVPDKNKLAPEYLFAFLKTKYAQEIIARGVYGSVIDEITPEYIGKLEIPVPKDKKIFEQIVNSIRNGEKERQKSIDNLSLGIELLEKTLAI